MRFTLLISALLLSQLSSAAQVYTCTDEKGRKTFSQIPCSPSAKATTIEGPEMMGSVATDTEATDKIRSSNQLRTIGILIERKEDEIDSLHNSMDRELAVLKAKGRYANNNLAGATWEQSLATEMQATTERYRVKIDMAQRELERLRDKQDRLSQDLQ